MDEQCTRRRFIERMVKNFIAGGAVLLGGSLLPGCQSDSESSKEKGAGDVKSCDDLSNVSEAERKKRQGFGYVEKTPMADKKCGNCNLYTPPKEGQQCGGCILFEGPVFAEGYCTYWAPQES